MPILISDIFIKYTKQFSLLINMYNVELKPDEVSLGEEMEVLVIKGKGDSIISRMKDGRVILFNRENPIFSELRPGVMVKSKVSFIAQNYIIVDPIAPPETGVEAIKLGLRMVSESDNWEMAVLSHAIMYIIEQFEGLS
jgi:hypothetical protein